MGTEEKTTTGSADAGAGDKQSPETTLSADDPTLEADMLPGISQNTRVLPERGKTKKRAKQADGLSGDTDEVPGDDPQRED